MIKILIYTKKENLDYWIHKIDYDLKNYKLLRKKNEYLIFNNLIKIYIKTKINESIRGHRWNEVILDAPISENIFYDNLYHKINHEIKKTENFKFIK